MYDKVVPRVRKGLVAVWGAAATVVTPNTHTQRCDGNCNFWT